MHYKKDFLNSLKQCPFVGILRDIPEGAEESVLQVAKNCGLKAIEVTMNTLNAVKIIVRLKEIAPPEIKIGAGTVRHIEDLNDALCAGAEFIVSPNTVQKIIEKSNENKVPIIPGALTPTEVQNAFDFGATAVKIFPVNAVGGPSYIKDLRGPFRDIPLLACGGVNPQNAKDFLKAGANLLAFGGSIFNAKLMHENEWAEIETRLKSLVECLNF